MEWREPLCPKPSRLDDWYLGATRAGSQPPAPVSFFLEVHEKVTRLWKAPFSARNRSDASFSLTTLHGGVARVTQAIPLVEHAVAMQFYPRSASTWRGNPVSSRLFLWTRFTELLDRLPPSCTAWHSCGYTRPRH